VKLAAEFTVHAVWAVALLSIVWFLGVLRVEMRLLEWKQKEKFFF
jgi:hypothetical protein